jgi:TolB protein
VDGSAPLDGSGPHAIIRTGNPFYFDWIGSDRLLAHIGTGPEAFLGEFGLDGEGPGGTLGAPGDFRSPVISRDGAYVGVVLAGPAGADGSAGPASIVLAQRDGVDAASMPVIGPAAMAFDPSGSRLAAIGAVDAFEGERAIPIGPVRVLEAGARAPRTLLDGSVVGFWWSPDGATLAAIRVAVVDGEPEIRLVFVDVASGDIRAEPPIRPSSVFIEQVLTYFDQYALSHRLWAPDSSSFLLPVIDADGASRVLAVTPDGEVLARLDGVMAFWSP